METRKEDTLLYAYAPEGFSEKTGFRKLIKLSAELPLFLEALKRQAEKQSPN